MLHAISWQQYLTAVFLLTAAWYTYVALRFKLINFKTKTASGPIPAVAGLKSVIGSILPDEGSSVDDISFGIVTPDDISDATIPKGPADDFIVEAQTLADVTETKCEFLSLLEILVMKYEQDQLHFSQLFNQLILPFTVAPDEWPQIQKRSA